jgi:radical SAM protein with 4Fe4S-binding SPASM domain
MKTISNLPTNQGLNTQMMSESQEILRLKSPLIVQYEITPACNNNCGFCYNFWQYDSATNISRKNDVNDKKAKKILDVLITNEVPAICYTGGEPFLSKSTLFDLVDIAHKNNIYTSINSNGRLITQSDASLLKYEGLNSILISLHGDSSKIHDEAVSNNGAFIQTIRGIENTLSAGINTTINYVSTQKNVDRIVETAQMLKNIGAKNMTITPLLPFPGVKDHEQWAMSKMQFKQYFNSLMIAKEKGLKVDSTLPVAPCILKDMFPENYKNYLEVLSPRVCMAGVSFMVVSPEGFNRACIQAPELKEYGDNINNDFSNAWKNSHLWSYKNLLTKECTVDCYALSSCGGGCRTSSLAMNNSVNGKTMYMGLPISHDDSLDFLKRSEVYVDKNIISFRKKNTVKLRKESFGGVLANISNQSFVFLDEEGINTYDTLPNEFSLDTSVNTNYYGIRVLQAAGMIESLNSAIMRDMGNHSINTSNVLNQDISIISINKFYERLAEKFQKNDNVIRMLRADTGERIYF